MRKITQMFLPLVMAFLVVSCNEKQGSIDEGSRPLINLTQDEFTSIAFDNPRELDSEEAIEVTSDFLDALKSDNATTRGISSNLSLEVSAKTYFTSGQTTRAVTGSSDEIDLPIYEVSITDGSFKGVAYVSGDERYPEVISYIPKTSDDVTIYNESGAVFFVEWAKASALDEINRIEDIREKYRETTISKISQELGISESEVNFDEIKDLIAIDGQPATRVTPVENPSMAVTGIYPPLVPIQWNQTPPYNRLLPAQLPPATQSNVYTGCAVTAIAQLLVACKPSLTIDGTPINWDYLSETPEISTNADQDKLDMAGKLFKWIYESVDARPQYDEFGMHTGTGVYTYKSDQFLSDNLNSGDMISYEPDVLLSSLNSRKPSWISGQNHAFIVDGYLICEKPYTGNPNTRADIVRYYDMYWHINLGWGGSYDGYYRLNSNTHVDIEAGSHTYNTQYLSIKPNLSKIN